MPSIIKDKRDVRKKASSTVLHLCLSRARTIRATSVPLSATKRFMLRKLLTDTVWYGLSSILGRLINYALVPLYTAALPVVANGVITTLYAYAAFLNVVLTFGMETAYFRFGRGTAEQEREQASRGQSLILVTCLATAAGLALAMPLLERYLPYPRLPQMVALLATALFVDALTAIPLARLRLQGRPKVYALARLGYIGLNILFNLFFILVCKDSTTFSSLAALLGADTQPVIWVLLAGLLSSLPLLLLINIRQFNLRLLAGPDARFMVRYALPIVAMGLAGMANQMLGILQLEKLLPNSFYPGLSSTEAVGVYGQCYKLSIFMALVVQAFRLGAEPFFFSMAGTADKEAGFALVMRWFVLACIGILVAVTVNLDWLAPLVLRRGVYFTGLSVVPTLLVANLFLGVYYNLSIWFKLIDRTAWGTWLSLGGMMVTMILNLWLVPRYGYDGAAASSLLCYGGMAAASYIFGQRYMPVPYAALRLATYILTAYLACSVYSTLTAGLALWSVWGIRIAYLAVYIILLGVEGWPLLQARRTRLKPSSL